MILSYQESFEMGREVICIVYRALLVLSFREMCNTNKLFRYTALYYTPTRVLNTISHTHLNAVSCIHIYIDKGFSKWAQGSFLKVHRALLVRACFEGLAIEAHMKVWRHVKIAM